MDLFTSIFGGGSSDVSASEADQYAGITDSTFSDPYNGDLGYGNTTPSDWFTSALTGASKLAATTASVFGILDGKKVVNTGTPENPIMQTVPNTGGPVQSQGQAAPNGISKMISMIPGWGWAVIAGVGAFIGWLIFRKK